MAKILSLATLILSLASAAAGAELHGTISENGKPLPAGVPVKIDCGSVSASATTDQYGSYSLKTTAGGDCRLTLDYKATSLSLKVTLYEKPNRYDLIVKEEAGKRTLARK